MTTIRIVDPLEIARQKLQRYLQKPIIIGDDDALSVVEACALVDIASSLRVLAGDIKLRQRLGGLPEPDCEACSHVASGHTGTDRPCVSCSCKGYVSP